MDDNDVRTPEREYEPRDYRYSIGFYGFFGLLGLFYTARGIFEVTDGDADGLDIFLLVVSAGLTIAAIIYLVNVLVRRTKASR